MMEYIDAFFDYAVQYSNSIFAAYLLFCFFLKKRRFFLAQAWTFGGGMVRAHDGVGV